MMSTLVSAGIGVVTVTSTCAAPGMVPDKVVIRKLLLELEALADCACVFGAGNALRGSEVPGCGVLGLVDMNLWGAGSGSLVRSICTGVAGVSCAGVFGVLP